MLELVGRRDASADAPRHVAPDVAYLRDRIVNVCFVGAPGAADREWALVDAGLPGSADRITHAAARLFGAASRPAAILLTHGHADHVGAVRTLMRRWDAPVYAHEMELPYLTGRSSYPPADPFVGGGAMSVLSVLFPRAPIHLGSHVHALPADGSVPGMRGWRWIPTPGHSPGHVSFVRDVDRTLIAGDAFVTTKNESLIAALTQRAELHGPPMYLTPDWDAARVSLRHLAAYSPSAAITGHGPPMRGEPLQSALRQLASQFDARARPAHGRYRDRPAIMSASGVVDVPPAQMGPGAMVVTGLAIGAAIGVGVVLGRRGGARAAAFAPSAADGGYDVTTATVPTLPVAVPPTSIELR